MIAVCPTSETTWIMIHSDSHDHTYISYFGYPSSFLTHALLFCIFPMLFVRMMIKYSLFFVFRQVRVAVVTVVLALVLPTLLAQHKIPILIIDNLNTRRHAKWQRHLMHKFNEPTIISIFFGSKLVCIVSISWYWNGTETREKRFFAHILIRLNYIHYMIRWFNQSCDLMWSDYKLYLNDEINGWRVGHFNFALFLGKSDFSSFSLSLPRFRFLWPPVALIYSSAESNSVAQTSKLLLLN